MGHSRQLSLTLGASVKQLQQGVLHKMKDADLGAKPPPWIELQENSWREKVGGVVYGPFMELVIGVVLLFNFAVMVHDTDIRASGEISPLWVELSGDICSIIYFLEFFLRWFVERQRVLRSSWNRLDFMVLAITFVEKSVSSVTSLNPTSLTMVRAFRIVRLLRLVRAVKLMSSLKELRKLIQMMATCVRTLFWSCVLTFILMTVWSVMLVELISPIVDRLEAKRSIWGGDTDWTLSYKTVMRANLTLFQTIVAGDSWGKVPIPVIDDSPWTVILFLPAQVTLVFGVLNLILAVIVDTFAENRSNDHATRTAELEREERQEKEALSKIFDRIDEDHSGSVTLEELEDGAANDTEFRQRLRVMDVSKADLQQLFAILDGDGSGDVDPEEFIDTLYRMKCADSRTATVLVKHTVADILKRQDRIEHTLKDMMDRLWPETVRDSAQKFSGTHLRGVTPTAPPSCPDAASEPLQPWTKEKEIAQSNPPDACGSSLGPIPPLTPKGAVANVSLYIPISSKESTPVLMDSNLSISSPRSPRLPGEDSAPCSPQKARRGKAWLETGRVESPLQGARNADLTRVVSPSPASPKPSPSLETSAETHSGAVKTLSSLGLRSGASSGLACGGPHTLIVEFRPDKTKRAVLLCSESMSKVSSIPR